MNYRQALDYLLSFTDFERSGGFTPRPDVAPVRALLRHLDEPHRGRLTVHVAGSKGKGSTAAMIASILRECGLTVGLYTSPHLHHICERIRIDGEPISEDAFARYAAALPPALDAVRREMPDRKLVTFDLLTAMAFLAFREAQADVQVLETGLGGRVDSTNAVDEKEVCVITSVSLEHQAILGDTLPQIAAEKAGIIAPGADGRAGDAGRVSRRSHPAYLQRTRRPTSSKPDESCSLRAALSRHRRAGNHAVERPRPSTTCGCRCSGLHQVENAVAAVLAVEALREHGVEASTAAGARRPGEGAMARSPGGPIAPAAPPRRRRPQRGVGATAARDPRRRPRLREGDVRRRRLAATRTRREWS